MKTVCECVRCYRVREASDAGRPQGFDVFNYMAGLGHGEHVVKVRRSPYGGYSVEAALVGCSACGGTGSERSL